MLTSLSALFFSCLLSNLCFLLPNALVLFLSHFALASPYFPSCFLSFFLYFLSCHSSFLLKSPSPTMSSLLPFPPLLRSAPTKAGGGGGCSWQAQPPALWLVHAVCDRGRLGCPEHYLNTHTAPDTQTYTHIHSNCLCQSSPALSAQALLKLFFSSSLSLSSGDQRELTTHSCLSWTLEK